MRISCALILLVPGIASAQSGPGTGPSGPAVAPRDCEFRLSAPGFADPARDIARLLDLQDTASRNSFMLRRSGQAVRVRACAAPAHLRQPALRLVAPSVERGFAALPAHLLLVANSGYPRDWNDGALWGGRGLNVSLTAGFEGRWRNLSAAIAPVVAWQSNSTFDHRLFTDSAGSSFRHPWWGTIIDAPTRFGTSSFTTVDPGHSFVRVDVRGFAAGISNEAIAWGPARRNPLVLSGTAPGFAHVFVETARPHDVWIGDLEGQLFWGRLDESDYFDDDPDNDSRLLAGLMLALHPRFMDGLAIGGGRTQSFTWWSDLSLSEVLLRPYRGVTENPQGFELGDNQLITLFFRWSAAPAGLEVYGEWAREDHWGTAIGLLRNLDSSQGYTLGFQKLIGLDERALRVAAEITHLADALPVRFASRGLIPFYSNTAVPQGHTHRGQMLGAPIGTGAESQWIGADLFTGTGRTSISLERARYEDDAYYVNYSPTFAAQGRDSEWSLRLGHLRTFDDLAIDIEAGWSTRYNRGFLGLDSIAPGDTYRRDTNLSLRLGVRWSPASSVTSNAERSP